jgi:glycosyltransferase involved in cell wall biosynthesis
MTPADGFLRLLVVFHESEALGAGRSVLGTFADLRDYGWSPSALMPADGPFVADVAAATDDCAVVPKPIAYSLRGWRAGDGVAARAAASPAYMRRVREEIVRLRPHVVHANTLRSLPEAAVARSLGLPVVLHVHELPEPGAKRTAALRAAARLADVLVVVSDAVAAMVRRHAGSTPVVVVRNGAPLLPPIERSPEPGVVGTIGTVCREKGTDVFVEAAALALARKPHLRFEHVGQRGLDNDAAFDATVDTLAARPELEGRLAFLGRREAAAVLGRWEMFVLPSRTDAFPLATLEAMAAGVPVIAADVGGIPEQIVHLESGILMPPGQPDVLADWIVRLADDAELRTRLGRAGAERVTREFDLHRQAAGMHTAYLGALNLRYAPPPARDATLKALA